KVVSKDTKNNTRVVSFTLSSLANKLNGTVRVDWDAINYHHLYNIRFEFNESSAMAVTDSNPSVPGTDEDGQVPIDESLLEQHKGGNQPVLEEKEKENEKKEGETTNEQTGSNNAVPTVVFTDVASHWAKASIEKAVRLGIVNGFN